MGLVDYLVDMFGYNEPFFVSDIVRRSRITDETTLKNDLNLLVEQKKLYKYASGIYYIPNPNSRHNADEQNTLIKKRLLNKINCGI